jgi:hypothetical protein
VGSRNLENEEAKARYWAAKIQPQWVLTPGKQTFYDSIQHNGDVSPESYSE